ncbi:MAG: LysR family transcriptional regulator [Coriobacteriia bacterium]|nr:LysR family transcriptional regulator [Coriobacteriia bacterium]
MSTISHLKPSIRLSIKNPESGSNSVLGRGVADLCLGVRETGSLNAASKKMRMAYSKAWRIVKETEKALDVQLLNRDGAHGSTLTPEGDRIVDAYVAVNEKLQKYAEEELAKLLK